MLKQSIRQAVRQSINQPISESWNKAVYIAFNFLWIWIMRDLDCSFIVALIIIIKWSVYDLWSRCFSIVGPSSISLTSLVFSKENVGWCCVVWYGVVLLCVVFYSICFCGIGLIGILDHNSGSKNSNTLNDNEWEFAHLQLKFIFLYWCRRSSLIAVCGIGDSW